MFNNVIYYNIIKQDISLVNSFLRTCKQLNKQILCNNELMHDASLRYIPTLKRMIDQQIKIALAIKITPEPADMIYQMYLVDSAAWDEHSYRKYVLIRNMDYSEVSSPSRKYAAFLENTSNKDAIKNVDQCFELYTHALKYCKYHFPYHINLNDTINLYKNFKFIINYITSEHKPPSLFVKTKNYIFEHKGSFFLGLVLGSMYITGYLSIPPQDPIPYTN